MDETKIGDDSIPELRLSSLMLQMSQEDKLQSLIHSGRYRVELMKVSGGYSPLPKPLTAA